MVNNNGSSYINSKFGRVTINVADDGFILVQNRPDGSFGAVALSPEEGEKLAKALLAKKRDNFSSTPQTRSFKVPQVKPPTFNLPQSNPTSHMEQVKAKYPNAYTPWTNEDDELLKKLHSEGKSTAEIAEALKRNDGAITSRIAKIYPS